MSLSFNTADTTGSGIAGTGDAALLLAASAGNDIDSFTFRSNDGTNFRLDSFVFSFNGPGSTNVTIEALDDSGNPTG